MGAMLVREANNGIRAYSEVWRLLGMSSTSREEGARQLAKISELTAEGEAHRAELHRALEDIECEIRSLGRHACWCLQRN